MASHERPRRRAATASRIKVLLLDDHESVVEALAGALEREDDIDVVCCAGSVHEVASCQRPRPDVAVVDYSLPDGTGADACRQIKARWPQTHILMLSGSGDREAVLGCIQAGADGFLSKTQRLSAVVGAIRDAFACRPIVSPELLGTIARTLPAEPPASGLRERLTAREHTVLRALAAGRSTRQIATDLAIAEGTVRRHVEAIRRKFGVATRLEAVTEALRHHIVELPATA